jgi:YQGE family putative transporter
MLGCIHSIVGTFFGTFLIAYIMQISSNEAVSLSIFNIAFYTAIAAGFLMLADYVKRRNKMFVYRFSVITQILLLLAIAWLKDGISPYIAILGAAYGLALAFRHCPLNIMTGEKINKRLMTPFVGYKGMIIGIVSVLTPFLLGFFITAGSYEHMAIAMCFFLALEFALSFRISSDSISEQRFKLACFLSKAKRSILIRRVYLVDFLAGFAKDPLGVVVTMYIVYLFGTNFNLGILTSVFAGLSIAMNFLMGRFAKPKMFPRLLLVSNIVIGAAALLFLSWTGAITFIIYQFANATAIKFMSNIREINLNNASNSACVDKDSRAEFFVGREMALSVGRILGFLILFTIGFSGHMEWLKYYLVFLTAGIVLTGMISIKICRHGFYR